MWDPDVFQTLIRDCGCGEQYLSWCDHHDVEPNKIDDPLDYNSYQDEFVEFVMSQAS